jgi:DNA-binding FrmR family transcriptional regulator
MKLGDSPAKEALLNRVRKIEGQARGIARMIEEERDCTEILQQMAAVRSAAHKAVVELVRVYAFECAESEASPQEISESLAAALSRLA